MASFKSTYIDQLLLTATKENVIAEHALYTDRMCLFCKVCKAQLTVPEPDGDSLDYGVQEFIKIHSHVGGHKAKPICTCGGPKTGPEGTFGQAHHDWCPAYVYVKPVTLDFKTVESEEARIKRDIVALNPISKPKSKILKIATGRKFR